MGLQALEVVSSHRCLGMLNCDLMVSFICIVSVEICCFQQLNRHCVFRRGLFFWGGGEAGGEGPAGRAGPRRGAGSGLRAAPQAPGSGRACFRTVLNFAKAPGSPAPRDGRHEPGSEARLPGRGRWGGGWGGGGGRRETHRQKSLRRGAVCVCAGGVAKGCKTCWGQAEGPRRQAPVLFAGEGRVSPEGSGLGNLISCQNSHGDEARPGETRRSGSV